MKIISNKNWNDYQEWLNSPIEYTVHSNVCTCCGEPLFFDKPGLCEECSFEEDNDLVQESSIPKRHGRIPNDDIVSIQEDIEDLYNDNKILHDIMDENKRIRDIMKEKIANLEDAHSLLDDMVYDDLSPSVRTVIKDLADFKHTQKLINKVIESQICDCTRCKAGKPHVPRK